MDPVSLTAAATAIVNLVDWKAIAKKAAGDSAKSLWQRLKPSEREKAAKQAIQLFVEEFVKELDDKCPLTSAIPGYHRQLQRLIEPAAVDIANWLEPDIKTVDLAPVARMWSGLGLDLLPEDFDWQLVAQNYGRAIRQYIKRDPDLRQQLALSLQEDARSFDQRFAPGFDLIGYRDYLRKKCGMLQLSAMHSSADDRRITLWSVFVPQSARESAPVRDIPREHLRELRLEGQLAKEDRDERQIAELRETYQGSPVLPVLEILQRRQAVVLLGDPGSGKTSLLKYLVLQWAAENQGHFPLLVDLKEYAQQAIGLRPYLESGITAFGLDSRKVEEQLHSGEAALYLDGLDEVFDPRTRARVVEEIAAISSRYPRALVVVTSRIIGYDPERLRNAGFVHATLEDFDDGQVRSFVQKWHAVAEEDVAQRCRLVSRLERALKDSRAIRELAGNPLLLTMMAILNRNQELPRDRVELYREASRVLLHEWDASRALQPTDTFARQEKEALLRELAGAMQQTEGGLAGNLIARDRLIGVFRQFLAGLGIPDSYVKAESLVQQLTERNFVLCFAGADRFAFVHRTFLEYFCAAWFVEQFEKHQTLPFEQLKVEVFGQHWHDETWHEVLRLIAGMVGEKKAEELILFLMGLDGRSQKLANLMLAAGCLGEVRNRRTIQKTDQMLLERFFGEAIRYDPPYYYEDWEEGQETGPTRTKAVSLIASVWRSAEVKLRLTSLIKESQDTIVQMAAVQELARCWKDDPETLHLLKDLTRSGKHPAVRMVAVQEVARGWTDDPDALPWVKDHARFAKDPNVRVAAVEELARRWKDDPDTLPWLKDVARSDEDVFVRMPAVEELARGWKDDPDMRPWLKDLARDENNYVRRVAVEELARGWKEDPDTQSWLKDIAQSDESYSVRTAAVKGLARGWKEDPDTLPWLKGRTSSDENNYVRTAAVEELARGWKDSPGALVWLKEHARSDRRYDVRRAAAEELARGWENDPDTQPLLNDLARSDPNEYVRMATMQALAWGWKDDSETLPMLKDRARSDENKWVRIAAVRELARGWKDDPDTLPLLKDRARSDRDGWARRTAVRELACGWPDDPETLPLLKDRAHADEHADVRKAALRELARGWPDDPEVIAIVKATQ